MTRRAIPGLADELRSRQSKPQRVEVSRVRPSRASPPAGIGNHASIVDRGGLDRSWPCSCTGDRGTALAAELEPGCAGCSAAGTGDPRGRSWGLELRLLADAIGHRGRTRPLLQRRRGSTRLRGQGRGLCAALAAIGAENNACWVVPPTAATTHVTGSEPWSRGPRQGSSTIPSPKKAAAPLTAAPSVLAVQASRDGTPTSRSGRSALRCSRQTRRSRRAGCCRARFGRSYARKCAARCPRAGQKSRSARSRLPRRSPPVRPRSRPETCRRSP